ncbi:MAG: Spy0128 family protein [Ruminococcus sp.]
MKIVQRLYVVCFNIICMLSFCFNGSSGITASAYDPVNASIAVEGIKISDSNSHMYEIVIESLDNFAPVPESDRLFITDSGAGVFNLEITEPGTYVYKIYESPGNDINIIYDDTVYYATVFVTNAEDGGLTYSVSVKEANSKYKSDNVIFADLSSGYTTTYTTTATTRQTSVTSISRTSTRPSVSGAVTTTPSDNNNSVLNLFHTALTGDNAPFGLVTLIMFISAITGLIAFMKRDKERRQ